MLRAIAEAPIAPPSPSLTSLAEERANVVSELDRLGRVTAGVSAAETALADISGEEASLDAAEDEAMRRWADAGAKGSPPGPLDDRRADLSQRFNLAAKDAAAARRTAAAVAPRIQVLHGELRRVASEMHRLKIEAAMENVLRIHSKACEAGAALASADAELRAFSFTLSGQENAHASDEFSPALQSARQRFNSLKSPSRIEVNPAVVNEFAAHWRRALS